ncbi:alpha/beta hydrolase family protein [Glaciecola sp. SC05]|uniref:alpha/beta hydrolase family protein n=1 Tax=Glaciecola sp. SC05 TaxID=1987355 RepID=UPI003528D615
MRGFILLFALSFFTSSALTQTPPEQLFSGLPDDVTPELSKRGQFAVGVKTITVVNDKHLNPLDPTELERSLTLEVWYPTSSSDAEKTYYTDETRSGFTFSIQADAVRDAAVLNDKESVFPVVVISHGYTSYRTAMFHIGEHLASHGYIAVGIDHTGSTNADIDFATNPGAGFLSTLMNRARDQQFTLDWLTGDSEFAELADASSAGVIGHSMGGFGAINTIGACYDFTAPFVAGLSGSEDETANTQLASVLNICSANRENGTDPRWKAAAILAPWGGQHKLFSAESLASVNVPTIYISGDLDDISGYDGIRWMFDNHSFSSTYLLTYHEARHNIAHHPAPKAAYSNELDIGHYYESSWNSETLALINQHIILATMDCYLKSNDKACEYLSIRGSSNQIPVDGEKPAPWKGFDDRFSTGMTMEAKTP